jgi:hypothetical protein
MTFTTAFASSQNATLYYKRLSNIVFVWLTTVSAVGPGSNPGSHTDATTTPLPARLRPIAGFSAANASGTGVTIVNGLNQPGTLIILSTGVVQVWAGTGNANSWSASGTNGWATLSAFYPIA